MTASSSTDGTASPRPAWVYIVECADGTLYTGWCYELEARLALHNTGRGARYTRGRGPVRLRWYEPHPTRRAAMQREISIKQLPRSAKMQLINEEGTSRPNATIQT